MKRFLLVCLAVVAAMLGCSNPHVAIGIDAGMRHQPTIQWMSIHSFEVSVSEHGGILVDVLGEYGGGEAHHQTHHVVSDQTIDIEITITSIRGLPNVVVKEVAYIYHEVIEIQPLPLGAYTVNVNGQKKRFRSGRLRSGLSDETGDLPPMPLAAAHPIASQAKADAQRDAENDVKKRLWVGVGLASCCVSAPIAATVSGTAAVVSNGIGECTVSAYLIGYAIGGIAPFLGIFSHQGRVPSHRLIGNASEYVGFYSQAYRQNVRAIRLRWALAGGGIGCLITAGALWYILPRVGQIPSDPLGSPD